MVKNGRDAGDNIEGRIRQPEQTVKGGVDNLNSATRAKSALETSTSSSTIDQKELFKELEVFALQYNFNLKFSVDKATGRTVVKVIDADTKEIIREIPTKESLKVAAQIQRLVEQIIDIEA